MGVVLGVDGGNTKTDVVAATLDGGLVAYVRGAGSNSHGPGGAEGCIAVVAGLVAGAALDAPAEHGAFFLCGADVADDVAELQAVLARQPWVRSASVDNDTFALLHAGGATDAVAVVCGGGINCVGRRADGRVSHRATLGWETGDWGGAEAVGREALHHAARAEDRRGQETALVALVRDHFGAPSVHAVGEDVHYRRLHETRLGELAPLIVAAADGDVVARGIVERLIAELVLLVERAAGDLELAAEPFQVVLGGGMLEDDRLRMRVVEALGERVPHARVVVPQIPAAAGAAVAALEAVGAQPEAGARLRAAFRAGAAPQVVHG
ncbi:MAG: N-acetylglucosamine kinase [Gaiellaceae bacterium]